MPGMSSGLRTNNQLIVSAFHHQLLNQGLIILFVLLILTVLWSYLRLHFLQQTSPSTQEALGLHREFIARRVLRIGFGLLWIFDGILQAQSSMPLGMPSQVLQPAAQNSPIWVQHLVHFVSTIWSYHPLLVPASVVWIQVGIGLWLLSASRGIWSRYAAMASTVWGALVWALGESFGGIFSRGQSWTFGLPGAALLYCIAGVLIALPENFWHNIPLRRFGYLLGRNLGSAVLQVLGLFFIAMATLQAWPGRGSWNGSPHNGHPGGPIYLMLTQMAHTPQPHFLSSTLASFQGFDANHAWEINLFVVIALSLIGLTLWIQPPKFNRPALVGAVVLCIATWISIQDLGFLGGTGTDPNSMIPTILLLVTGYLGISKSATLSDTSTTGIATATAFNSTTPGTSYSHSSISTRLKGRILADPSYARRTLGSIGALCIILIGAVPGVAAASNPNANPIVAQAINGAPQPVSSPAPAFDLIDQNGRSVSLASLRGKTIALTFLDDVCVTTCPLIAQEFRLADQEIGTLSRKVVLIAINSNPRFITINYLEAFDQQEQLTTIPNWLFLTGRSMKQLDSAWKDYGDLVQYLPGGSMVDHSEIADIIGPQGRIRYIINTDPGPGTRVFASSFSNQLANLLEKVANRK